jgi:hypothetical protein
MVKEINGFRIMGFSNIAKALVRRPFVERQCDAFALPLGDLERT